VRFEHLEKVVDVVEQPAAQHIGEVIVQHSGVIAKLVRYLAGCPPVFSELTMMRALAATHMALLGGVRVDRGPSRDAASMIS
jgi:hypothetical protein